MTQAPGSRVIEFPVPALLSGSVVAWLAGGRPPGPAARPSATVMLLRARPLEVFMLRRTATMKFAPSMWVFPGGGVDPRDASMKIPWAGPAPEAWAGRMGVDRDEAAALVSAAAREVFEECGVLLAGPDEASVIGDVPGSRWRAERDALLSKEQSFAELLARHGLVLRSDLLSLRDHWITPECEPRRYDTWFFAAQLPEGQRADDDTSEADQGRWVRPGDLLAAMDEGGAHLLPPTIVQLRGLARATDPAALVAQKPRVIPVMPVPTPVGDETVMRVTLPQDPGRGPQALA